MQKLTSRAIADGHLQLDGEGKSARVIYVASSRSERWSDPEERVRAEFYSELIYRYGYAPSRIGVEITVPDRSPNDFADLVVFRDDERKSPFAVIECKRDTISDAEFNQAVEQAWGNGNAHKFRAAYVGVVAGATRRFLDCNTKFGGLERDKNVVADLPREYGAPPKWKFRKGMSAEWQDIRPVSKGELIAAIKKCHQTLWGGGRLSPPAAFGEFCKIIFVKVRDEKAPRRTGEQYDFQIQTDEAAPDLSKRIRSLYTAAQQIDPEIFKDPIRVDDGTLKMCVSHLEAIDFSATDLDTKGVAFEQFLDGFFKGDFGQYFTPREIIQFAVQMLRPESTDLVLDPACGSGGFLLYALDYIRHRGLEFFAENSRDHYRYWHEFAERRLFGIEINDEISRVAKMNMILHDDGHTNIVGADALEKFSSLGSENQKLKPDTFDLILTNPPFGAVIKETEKGKAYMEGWELLRYVGKAGANTAENSFDQRDFRSSTRSLKAKTSVKTEILFCERVWQFLKPSTGRAAIVLPDGILTNASLQGVRDWLIEKFQVLAIVGLPQAAFQHSGAGVKASVVFVRKRGADERVDPDEPIFMSSPENIGFDATGRATYSIHLVREEATRRVEIHSTDLFDTEVTFERASPATGTEDWQECGRRILPFSGVLGEFLAFENDPGRFLV